MSTLTGLMKVITVLHINKREVVHMAIKNFELFATTIAQISKSIQKIKSREMSKFGLRGAHVMCLFFLKQNERGLTAAELTELSGLDKGAVSRTLVELEDKELITCPEPENKRRYRVRLTLTEQGKKLTEKITEVIEASVDIAGRGLSDIEKAIMYKALCSISENLKKLASI
jgi:DNA-binding MarR family transcriptional regulator